VYEKSIAALKRLNAVGYGDGRSGLRLVLVTNPVGAFLPPAQASLEAEWKRELLRLHDIRFDALFCITNMPISRYLEWLIESSNLERYMEALVTSFNPRTVGGLMCRTTISVGWDGALYDCDFNQMLDMRVHPAAPRHIRDFDAGALGRREIVVGRHCFGCTAGAGSSCGGAVARVDEGG
jgi:radical SAM/Cys-rich protein